MITRRQHPEYFVDVLIVFILNHQIAFKVIDVEMELDRLEDIVIGVVIGLAWLVYEAMLGPSLADPAVRVDVEPERASVPHRATKHGAEPDE